MFVRVPHFVSAIVTLNLIMKVVEFEKYYLKPDVKVLLGMSYNIVMHTVFKSNTFYVESSLTKGVLN